MTRSAQEQANRRVLRNSALVVVGMFGFGFALVPIYQLVCQALGINGRTEQVAAAVIQQTAIDRSRTITVEFDAVVNSKLPWAFKPVKRRMQVHPGELKRMSYIARNLSGEQVVGQAIHSVTPVAAAAYFKKTECFCYTQQGLASGEAKDMPVAFMIDPELPPEIDTVTLSYSVFRADQYAAQ